jgi:hypothetical protein
LLTWENSGNVTKTLAMVETGPRRFIWSGLEIFSA